MTCKLQTKELLIASHNQGKLREFATLVADFSIELRSAAELGLSEPAETGTTFAENAAIKARFGAQATGLVTLADDSGLSIEALDGAPGISSADWAIQKDGSRDFAAAMARIERELQARGAVRPKQRRCHFICVLCLAWPDGETCTFHGEVWGHIHYPPSGAGGFGYDPIFMPEGYNKTFAEMTAAEKHGNLENFPKTSSQFPGIARSQEEPLSHRARALKLFRQAMLDA